MKINNIRVTQTFENSTVPLAMRDEKAYSYGFNGMERDDEISGSGNSYTAEFWQYDSRLGRRWNVDPVYKYHLSNYSVLGNNPIIMIDPQGDDWYRHNKTGKVVWLETQGQDIEGYTFLGEFRYWDNNFNSPETPHHWEYFNFLGRGTKNTRILKNTLLIAGGVTTIALSGGLAAPLLTSFAITSGSFSVASGTAQLVLNLANAEEVADQVPGGYLDAVVGVTVEYTVEGERYKQKVKVLRSVLNITESTLTMNLERMPKNALEATDFVLTGIQIIGEANKFGQGSNNKFSIPLPSGIDEKKDDKETKPIQF